VLPVWGGGVGGGGGALTQADLTANLEVTGGGGVKP